jgi:hypothetical protein
MPLRAPYKSHHRSISHGNKDTADTVFDTSTFQTAAATAAQQSYLQYLIDFLFKVHVQQLISLIKHQMLEGLQTEPLGVGQVVNHTARCTHNHMRPLGKGNSLAGNRQQKYNSTQEYMSGTQCCSC